MKKFLTFFAVTGLLTIGSVNPTWSQTPPTDTTAEPAAAPTAVTPEPAATEVAPDTTANGAGAKAEVTFTEGLKITFIEGDPAFMTVVLLCLIVGLAICIERIIYLNLATSNTKALLSKIDEALKTGGVEAAKDVCRNTRGPVASIFYQGLDRSSEGIDMVEKSVISYGGVQMGLLEKGLPWIGLMIALAPMLGFLGTVYGMIQTFTLIGETGEADPAGMAVGIKLALITTVGGLVVAIILQIFYNYIISKIDGLVIQMEDASISLIDILVKHKLSK
jgi:biopolymer transport protein ExbB